MYAIDPCQNERGAALVIGLMFVAIVAMLGATAVVLTTTDIQIGSNYKSSSIAFYHADAGVNYGLAKIQESFDADSTFLPTEIYDPDNPINSSWTPLTALTAPSGFNFSYGPTGLTKIGENVYSFTAIGTGPDNSSATITTIINRAPAINMGLFGDELVLIHNSASVYSYSHSVNPTPAAGDSTGEAGVGSNVSVVLKNSSFVDGGVALGEDTDTPPNEATLTTSSGAIYAGEQDVDRIDPDPLGVRGGEYADKFTTYSSSNLNCCGADYEEHAICDQRYVFATLEDDEDEIRDDNEIDISNDLTLKGKAGGANYYFTDITVKNGTTLYIDTTDGPVNIFLTGELECKYGSNIINTAGDEDCPADEDEPCCSCGSSCMPGASSKFSIFANSLSDSIVIKNGAEFHGLIYAPYMDIELHNSANVYGAVWGKTVEMKNSFDFYFDTDIKQSSPPGKELEKAAWKNVFN